MNMNCLKICGFVFALIALTTAEAATQVLNAGGHTLIQTDRTQYIRRN
ncbi:daisho2 [Drosophila obscura]|nr:daisho2 [Drosophila obscura]